jgi:ribonucleoside-diphosphate reductase alpha chain
MYVIKRDGTQAKVSFDEILTRIQALVAMKPVLAHVDCGNLSREVISMMANGMRTSEIDACTVEKAASKSIESLDYEALALRIFVSHHHKNTLPSFSAKVVHCASILDPGFVERVLANAERIDAEIRYERDYSFDYFGFCTLYYQNYLLKDASGAVVERPQDLLMRVSLFIHGPDLEGAFESYHYMSKMYFTHASPTLFNAGLKKPGCISCFLASTDDSKEGIQRVFVECTSASAACGGIAFSASPWRSKGSEIKGNNGHSNGIVPFMRIMQEGVRAFNQGSRRNGSLAVYLDMHHPDLIDFIKVRSTTGSADDLRRCLDLFTGLWVSDLFMHRVKENGVWSFFDSAECPQLLELYGEEYEKEYIRLESAGAARAQMKAREVWKTIFEIKRESGMPYLMAKDSINRANNQENVGLIRTSNLCAEIVEYTENLDASPDTSQTACCTLASISLPSFVMEEESKIWFDYGHLGKIVGILVRNLNLIVDASFYPTAAASRGAQAHRPIGIGVQGLADVYFKFKFAFESPEAEELNRRIFETIYYSAVSHSSILARKTGAYSSFRTGRQAPLARGIFNFEMHGLKTGDLLQGYDWESLRAHVQKHGVKNSLLIACMPTASTSQIFRNTECFEPVTANIYLRKVLGGEYFVINKHLYRELSQTTGWTPEIVAALKQSQGSVQGIVSLPLEFRVRFKTAWEIDPHALVRQATGRQPFVDQSQSMNLYFENFNLQNFTDIHFAGWRAGLKTLSYYIRQRPAAIPFQTTLSSGFTAGVQPRADIDNQDHGCTVCGT